MAEKRYLDYDGLSEVVDKSKETFQKREFVGTRDEWDGLSASEKAKYEMVNITDDDSNPMYAVTDAVTNGDMRPVTSNAVYGQVYHKMGQAAQSSITDVNVFTTFENYAQANRWVFANFPFTGTCTNLPDGATSMNTYCWMYKSGGGTMKVRLMDCYSHDEWVTQKVGGVWGSWEKLITQADLAPIGTVYNKTTTQPLRDVSDWYVEEPIDVSDLPSGVYLLESMSAVNLTQGISNVFAVNNVNHFSMVGGAIVINGIQTFIKTSDITQIAVHVYVGVNNNIQAGTNYFKFTRIK